MKCTTNISSTTVKSHEMHSMKNQTKLSHTTRITNIYSELKVALQFIRTLVTNDRVCQDLVTTGRKYVC